MANPIELLVTLGVDDAKTLASIRQSVNKLQNDKSLNFDVNVSNAFKGLSEAFSREANDVKKLTRDLDNFIKRESGEYKFDFRIDEAGQKRLRQVTANIRNELGNLERVTFRPQFDGAGVFQGLRQVRQQVTDISTKNLTINTENAIKDITRLRDQGKITTTQFEEFSSKIKNSVNNSQLDTALRNITNQTSEVNRQFKLDDGITSFQRQVLALQRNLESLSNTYRSTISQSQVGRLQSSIGNLVQNNIVDEASLRRSTEELNRLRTAVSQVGLQAQSSATSANRFADTLRTVGERIASFGLIYGAFNLISRGVRDLTTQVIELDGKLVDLRRVLDIPEYEFNTLLERSIANVSTLSGNLQSYLDLVGEFGRTGLSGDESIALADTATLLQNISDLDAKQSFDAITAAMVNFNIQARDSVQIADALNEVDNNFAITTQDLGQSLNRAASTARTFGVSLNDLIGYTTAIGSATRESGNIIGNSLKTIFARVTTNSKAIDALESVGISIQDYNGEARSSSDVLTELAGRWDTLSDSQRQQVGVGVAGIYQLSRFNALMLNFATAQKAATTAANSFNSANREQQIFNQSLEARINRLNTAWSSFASTVGDELLYDGIVVVTTGLESLTKSSEDGAESVGVLAPAFGILGLALLALSPALRTLIAGSLPQLTAASLQASGATTVFGTSLARLGTVATVANASIRLLSFAGPLVAFAALGFAIEKVTSALADNIKQQEELDQYNQNNIDSLTKNKAQVDELLLSYQNLSAQRESAPLSPEAEREYLDVQNRIAEVFPALIDYIDSTGQAHIKNSEAIDIEIAKTKELIDVQNQVSIGDSLQAFEDLNNRLSGGFLSSGNLLYGSLKSQLEDAEEEVARLNRFDIDDSAAQLNLINIQQQISNTYDEIRGQILSTSTAVAELNGTLVDPKLNANIQGFLQNLDFSNLDNEGLQSFTYDLGIITSQLQSAFSSGDSNAFDGYVASLNNLASQTDNFDPKINSLKLNIEGLSNATNLTTIPIDTLGLGIEDLGEDVVGAGESLSGFNAEAAEFKDVVEQISGVSQSVIDSNNDLLFQYEALSARLSAYSDQELQDILNKTNLTNAELAVRDILIDRGKVTGDLIAQYPTLLGQDEDAISLSYEKITAVRNENIANENLLAGYRALRDGKLNAEQAATLATAQGTKDRIGAIRNEIQALIILQTQIANTSLTNREFAEQVNSGKIAPSGVSFVIPKIVDDNVSKKTVELAELERLYNATTTNIGSFVSALGNSSSAASKASKSASDSAKSASKATKENTYVTDKYAQAISDLDLEIEKQVNSRKTLNDFDAKYRTSLSAQIKLEERRLQLEKNQAAQLQKQISAGTGGQKVVDETKESLNRLRSEILGTTDSITTLAAELVNSNLSNFDNLRANLDRFYSVDSSILQNTNRDTAKYNDLLDHQILILNKKQAINQQEVDYLNKQIFSGKLTSQQLSELNGRFTELTVTINDLNTEVARLELDKLGSFQDAQEKSSRLVEYYNQVLTTLTEGTDEYNKALELSTKSTKDLIREQENELKALIYLATNARLSGEVFDDVTARTQELTLSISRLNNELLANDVNASKEALDKIYNQYVNTYKDAVNQRKEDTLRALTAERKAEDDAYKARVKRLNDELDLFRRNANERLALIDKEESDRSYEEDIEGLSSSRNDLQSDLNVRLADNSRQGIAQRAAIQEQIDAIDKEIAEKRRDRDITLQKEALQQNITDKESEINSRLEQEEEAYNYVVDRIDRQKEYYEDYYNDLLNDERKFARVREEIAKGNFESITVEFEGFIGDLTATLPELENTFDGTWQAVGTSIRTNVIDSLKEALELLNQYNASSFAGASFGGGSFSGVQSSGTASFNTTLSNGDKQVLLGKLLRENLVGTSAPANDPYIIQKGNAIAAKGRASGSTISAEVDLPTILSGLGRQDLQELSAYFNSQARSIVDTPSLQNLILDYAKNIASLDTGGFVNTSGSGVDGRGGKVGILHPNEIVLDKVDTKQYIAGIDILRNAMPILSSIARNFNPQNLSNNSGDVIDIKFLGNIYTQNQDQVNGLANTIVEGIKRRGGTFK